MDKYRMHNLYAIFAKLLNRCKQVDDSSFVWLSFTNLSARLNHAQKLKNETSYPPSVPAPYPLRIWSVHIDTEKARSRQGTDKEQIGSGVKTRTR